MVKSDHYRERLRRQRSKILDSTELTNTEKKHLLELGAGLDDTDLRHTSPLETKAAGTIDNYLNRLRALAEGYNGEFHQITERGLKMLLSDFASGTNRKAKDGGYATGTMGQFQSAAKAFVRHHGLPIDADDIPVSTAPKGSQAVDERDMFDNSDIEAMRDVIDNPRDEALFELLLNTGQRVRAIQTLRVKDVDVKEGVYWLNTEAEGLKGADKVGRKRPLLGAVGPVKSWLDFHPTGKPDDYLITATVNNNKATPGEMLAQQTIRQRLRKIGEKAGIDKPVNPHNFRHSFVTMCKRDYNMDSSTIKFLIGHAADSTVMETTYQHLTDEDYIADAEVATGRREPDDTPAVGRRECPNPDCLNELDPSDKACPSCGTVVSPDAKQAQEQIESQIREQKEEADSLEEYKDADKIAQAIDDDPKLAAQLMDKLGELADE